MNHPSVLSQPATASMQQSVPGDDEEESKQQLAQEILRIEEELERKRLEDEIKRMENMIATHQTAGASSLNRGTDHTLNSSLHSEASAYEASEVESDYDDEEVYMEEEVLIEGSQDGDYDSYDEEYIEEIIEDDDDMYSQDDDEYEIEYIEEEEEEADDGYGDFGGHETLGGQNLNSPAVFDLQSSNNASSATPPVAPPSNNTSTKSATSSVGGGGGLMGAITNAANARCERLDEHGAELKMKEHVPTRPAPARPMDVFDLTAMVSQKARERTDRLEAGGEKRMTEIKSKSEYKIDFNNVALEAAELGRLTRLKEHCVEATAAEKTPEEEWRSKGLMAIQWRNTAMSVIHEAARAGAASKLPEKVVSNFNDEEDDDEYCEYDENKPSQKRVSSRMKQLLAISGKVGGGQTKVDSMIEDRKEEKLNQGHVVRDMHFYQPQDINSIKLPRRKPPKIDPVKELQKIQEKLKGTYRQDKPLSNISNEVAERAWARRTRLDRPGSMPRVQEICNCPYCLDPSPFQTFAYKERERERKESGYVSPDSEEERQKAREKRRIERRKNRPPRVRGDNVPGGMRVAAELMANGSPERRTRRSQSSSLAEAARRAPTLRTPPMQTRSNEELPTSQRSYNASNAPNTPDAVDYGYGPTEVDYGYGSNDAGAPPVRREGKIRATARRMSMTGGLPPGGMIPQSAQTPPENQPPPPPPAATPAGTPGKKVTKRVVRRRRPQSESSNDQGPTSTPKSPGKAPKSPSRRSSRQSGTSKNKVPEARKVMRKNGSQVTEKVIEKSDGSRVVQTTTTPTARKVVTRKVIVRSANGKKKKVRTTQEVFDETSGKEGSRPQPVQRNVSRNTSMASHSSNSSGPVTRRIVTRTSNGAPGTRVVSRTTSNESTNSSSSGPVVTVTRGGPNGRTVTTTTHTTGQGAPGTRVVSRSVSNASTNSASSNGRTVTTTTTTSRKAAPAQKRSFFGRKKQQPQLSEI